MKTILFLIVLSFSYSSYTQWNLTYQQPSSGPIQLELLNKDTILAFSASNSPVLHRSVDGGVSWSIIFTSIQYALTYDMNFPSSSVGYICGGNPFSNTGQAFLMKTENSGQTWSIQPDSTYQNSANFSKVHFIDENIGFGILDSNLLLKTIDGGGSFSPISIPNTPNLSEVWFKSPALGFVSTYQINASGGQDYKIYLTSDQGSTWSEVYSNSFNGSNIEFNNHVINEIYFVDETFGFAVGGLGLFMNTIDGGLNWSESFILDEANIFSVQFLNENKGYITKLNGIYVTENTGLDWHELNLTSIPTMSYCPHFRFVNDTVGFAILSNFDGKAIYKTTTGGGILNTDAHSNTDSSIQIYPNPAQTIISISSEISTIKSIRIYNNQGQLVISNNLNIGTIDISTLNNGLYSVLIETEYKIISKKLVKY